MKFWKWRSSSEKETSEENYDEPSIDEKENEDQNLICVESEKDDGTIWEVIQLLPPPSIGRKDGNRKSFSICNPGHLMKKRIFLWN